MKRIFVLFALIVVLALLAACAAPTPEPTKAPAPTTAPAAAPTSAPAPTQAPAATKAPEPTKAAAPTTAAPAAKKILRIAMYREMDTLNPFTSQMLGEVFQQIFEGLTMANDKNTYFGVMAKEIPTVANGGVITNKDGKPEMTWKLQENAKWQDGADVDANDVCFTWNWIVGDDGKLVYNQGDYKNIEKCEVVDKYTVKFTWKNTFAKYNTLFEALMPKHLLEGKAISTLDSFNRAPIGNGPFKFAEWKAGQYIRLVKNENYWRGKEYPKFDEIVYYSIPDANTRLNGMKAGEYDLAQLDTTFIKQAANIPGIKTVMVSQNAFYHFDYSLKSDRTKKLFGDINVRKAIFYALDRTSISKDLFDGNVTVADTVIHPTSPYFNPNVTKYGFDLDKSKKMLDDAGWKVGSDGIRAKDGEKMSFTILTRSDADRTLLAQAIQAMLKKVNIEVKVDSMQATAYTNQWRTGDWEALLSAWVFPADPSFTRNFGCGASNNMTSTCDADLDKIMNASDQELDVAKRKDLSFQAQQKLAEDAFELPIFYSVTPFIMNPNFQNFKPNGTNMTCYWNTYEWDITK